MAKQIVFSLQSLKDGEIPDEGTMSDMLVKRGPTYKGTAAFKEADSTVFDVNAEEYPEADESFTTEGATTLTFSTYDYDPEILVAYKGGSITEDGLWAKPSYPPEIERSWQTISKDGYIIEIPRGKLRSKFNYEMKQDGVALLENTVTVMKPRGAGVAGYYMGKYKLPTVNAGNAQNITVANANLVGTATAFRGAITSKIWTCVLKPDAAAAPGITTPAALNTAVTGLVTGTYKFQLAVADENGFENKATVTITVVIA